MGYVQVSSLGDYISRQTGARVATAMPGGFPQGGDGGFPQDGDGDDGGGDGGGGGWQPWMAPGSPWSRGQATADARRRRHTSLPQRGGHGGAHGGHGGRMHGLGYASHPFSIQQLATHVNRRVHELQQRGGQHGFERGGQHGQAHPFRLWGRHPMAPICTDPSCPQCTDPNFPGYNPSDPICQADGLSGCLGALAPVFPIRGTPISVRPPIHLPIHLPVGPPVRFHLPPAGHVNIARSPGELMHHQAPHHQALPGWGARRMLRPNNRRGWARGTSNSFPWNVSPVCSDRTSGFYNPRDPSCSTGVNPVCTDPTYPGYNPNDPSCPGGGAASTAATASSDTSSAAPAQSGGGSSMPSWIWLAGGAVLLFVMMKK